jgi:DNA-binding transcriptional LysR family regulator
MSNPWELPDLVSLRLVVEVLDGGSIGEAARRLGITQASASERLATLERRLGVTLFARSRRGTAPTDDGRAVADWASEVLDAADRLVSGVVALRERSIGTVRVAASLTVADFLVPGWLSVLRRRVPGVAVQLEVANSSAVAAAVAAGSVDLGFVEGGGRPPGLVSRTVRDDRLVVVVPPDHRWARRRAPLSASELAATPMVVREHGSGTREVLEQAVAVASSHPGSTQRITVGAALGSTQSIKAAVLAGQGPGVVSELAVGDELARHQLVEVPVDGLVMVRRIRVVWRQDRPPSGAIATLVAVAEGRRA